MFVDPRAALPPSPFAPAVALSPRHRPLLPPSPLAPGIALGSRNRLWLPPPPFAPATALATGLPLPPPPSPLAPGIAFAPAIALCSAIPRPNSIPTAVIFHTLSVRPRNRLRCSKGGKKCRCQTVDGSRHELTLAMPERLWRLMSVKRSPAGREGTRVSKRRAPFKGRHNRFC